MYVGHQKRVSPDWRLREVSLVINKKERSKYLASLQCRKAAKDLKRHWIHCVNKLREFVPPEADLEKKVSNEESESISSYLIC